MIKIPAFIFARGNSKGLKNKNLKTFCGKPLIYWSIEACKKSKYISEIYVSTDSKKIQFYAKKFKAKVPFTRPKKYSNDNSPEISAWLHMLRYFKDKKIDIQNFVSVPVTSPLRTSKDLDNMISIFFKKKS